jgi:integrase/recombinase XerD
MTQLRQKMLEELQRRNYSHRTVKTYVRIIGDFAAYFHQPPDKLGPEQPSGMLSAPRNRYRPGGA